MYFNIQKSFHNIVMFYFSIDSNTPGVRFQCPTLFILRNMPHFFTYIRNLCQKKKMPKIPITVFFIKFLQPFFNFGPQIRNQRLENSSDSFKLTVLHFGH